MLKYIKKNEKIKINQQLEIRIAIYLNKKNSVITWNFKIKLKIIDNNKIESI